MRDGRYYPRAMEGDAHTHSLALATPNWRDRAIWAILLLGLLLVQAWLTCGLFGRDPSFQSLLDDQPILSGRHPLHLYHGHLGARAFFERGTLCCFDPAFQAGYPKTPVFDGGSRPAELFLALAGGGYHPAAYKIGLAVCLCCVPLFMVLAAWGVGLGRNTCGLAGILAIFICWGLPGRELVEAGDLDLLMSGLAALVHVGFLVRVDRGAGLVVWLGLLATGCLGWFAQPLVFGMLALPLLMVYYATVGTRHGLGWHITLLTALAGGIAANAFWLIDALNFWWVLLPLPLGECLVTQRNLKGICTSAYWGELPDRVLALTLLFLGSVGLVLFNQRKGRVAARLLGLGGGGLAVVALAGLAWEPFASLGTTRLLVLALWFAALPAACACQAGVGLLGRVIGGPWRASGIVSAGLLVAWAAYPTVAPLTQNWHGAAPLEIGLGNERQALVDVVGAYTSAEARILWEDRDGPRRWTALLPLLTERAFLGGWGPDAVLEHAHATLTRLQLAGRPLAAWSDAELDDFSRRYNLGWVACWSPAAVQRFGAWKQAERTTPLREDGQTGQLFTLKRPRSFVLKGQARWLRADSQRIELGDVVPEGDQVVLSLHYQAGMVAAPSRVRLEADPDTQDPIPFVRLRLTGPVTRITLTWQTP